MVVQGLIYLVAKVSMFIIYFAIIIVYLDTEIFVKAVNFIWTSDQILVLFAEAQV
jgi:hypothetical protein